MSAEVDDYFKNTISMDFFRLFAGDVIGTGLYRTVYECPVCPDLVIKVEIESRSFQNVLEWETWEYNSEYKPVARWLAPCVAISPCGSVLLMKRTTPVPADKFPRTLPAFITDTKRSNFGLYEGRVVCHDYGVCLPDFPLKRRKADWWGDS